MTPAPHTGAPTDSAHDSSSLPAEVPPTSGGPPTAAPPAKEKRAGPRPYSATPLELRAQKVKARAEGATDTIVQSDARVLDQHLGELVQAEAGVELAHAKERAARAVLHLSQHGLRPALLTLCWALRVTPGSRKFVAGRRGKDELLTAERLLKALPESGFTVLPQVVHALEAAVAPTRAHFDAWTTASTSLEAARARFLAASTGTRAAITTLHGSLLRAQVSARLKSVVPVAKTGSASKRRGGSGRGGQNAA
jgi:hypothetical protein